MKVLIILYFLFTSIQSNIIYVKNDTFEVLYSEELEQPLEVKYEVKCISNIFSRKGLDFHKVDGINTSDDLDYVNNFYDKGHLAPAGSFNCNEKMLIETFSYLNCALQRQELNRGVWKYLENHERVLAQRYKVNVIVKCVFSKNSIRLKTGATIPDAFYKEIYYDNKVEIYYFPNEVPKYRKYINYKIENPLK